MTYPETKDIEIPEETVEKWQKIVDLIVRLSDVPVALIMRAEPPHIEVFRASNTEDNPYEVGDREHLSGLYCEEVIRSDDVLCVEDARTSERWKDNPDVEMGMISYYGLPLQWPDGDIFGTLCVLDSKPNSYDESSRELLAQFQDVIETHLELLYQTRDLARSKSRVEDALRDSERKYRNIFTLSPEAIAILDREGRVVEINQRLEEWLRYSPEELKGCGIQDIPYLSTEQRNKAREKFKERLNGEEEPEPYELELLDKQGGRHVGLVHGTKLMDDQGNPVGDLVMISNITKRQRAEDALRESENRLKAALRGGELGTWDWDLRTNRTQYDERWAEMLGYTLSEIEPHLSTWEELVHPEDLSHVYDILNAHLEGDTDLYEAQYRMKHRSGDWIWILDKGEVIERDEEGNAVRACGTHMDITKYKEARERLSELSSMVEQSADGILRTDTDFRITYMNRTAEDLFGWQLEEVRGKRPDMFNADPAAEDMQKEIYRTVSEGKTYAGEALNKRKDGSTFYCQFKVSPIRDENGHVTGYMGSQRDVTEHRQAEKALRRSEELFRGIFEQASVGIAQVAPDGTIMRANEAFCEMVGYPQDELTGMTFQEITHPDDVEPDVNYIQQMLRGEISRYSMEKRYIRKDGDIVWANLSVGMVRNADGSPAYFASVVEDITEDKKKREKLRIYRKQLQELATKLSFAEERERRRIASDLHDWVAQGLIIGKMQLGRLRQHLDSQEATEVAERVDECMEDCLEHTRTLMFDLCPTFSCENGFEHQVAVNLSQEASAINEAFSKYLGWCTYNHTGC